MTARSALNRHGLSARRLELERRFVRGLLCEGSGGSRTNPPAAGAAMPTSRRLSWACTDFFIGDGVGSEACEERGSTDEGMSGKGFGIACARQFMVSGCNYRERQRRTRVWRNMCSGGYGGGFCEGSGAAAPTAPGNGTCVRIDGDGFSESCEGYGICTGCGSVLGMGFGMSCGMHVTRTSQHAPAKEQCAARNGAATIPVATPARAWKLRLQGLMPIAIARASTCQANVLSVLRQWQGHWQRPGQRCGHRQQGRRR